MQNATVLDQTSDVPLARIDGADEASVRPFREFLAAYGIRVYFNKTPPVKPDYHLVAGDPDFVKNFFSTWHKQGTKLLVIIYGGTLADAKWITASKDGKAVLIDTLLPGSRVLIEIFGFFFTGKSSWLDLRSQKEAEVSQTKSEPKADLTQDRARIQASIDSIFQKSQPGVVRAEAPKPARFPRLGLVVVAVGATVVVPVVWYLTSLGIGLALLALGVHQLYAGNIDTAQSASTLAERSLGQGRAALSLLALPLRLVGQESVIRGQERLLSLADELSGSVNDLGRVTEKGKDIASLLLTQAGSSASGRSPAVATSELRDDLLAAENKLSLAKAELATVLTENTFPFSIKKINQLGRRAQRQITDFHETLSYLDNFLALYPSLAGYKETKTYLVLFQNSMELRPTGGFIGSLATVTLDQGRLSDLEIQDVYSIDGQLKGHVDPPRPIRELLNQEHWYLRDSNWDPDFAKSGARAAWFYEKETGKTVDGVIGISSPLLMDLLKATGPLDLPDYNDRITADNFFGKSLYYTQNKFFPGSTQKKDFLGSLANALILKITGGKGVASPKLFSALTTALEQGNVVLMFADPQEQAVVERFGWAGRLPVSGGCLPEEENSCFSDTLSLIDANLGVNKVNYYIERFEQSQITLSEDGSVNTSVSLAYRNTSSAQHPSVGAGTYKVYTRFYLPPDAILTSAAIDGTSFSQRDFNKPMPLPPYLEVDTGSSAAKVVGLAFLVPPTSEHKISFSYRRGEAIRFKGNIAVYDFQLGRQPGVMNSRVETRIVYPIFWTAQQLSGEGTLSFLAKQGRLEYNTSLSHDQRIRLKFLK